MVFELRYHRPENSPEYVDIIEATDINDAYLKWQENVQHNTAANVVSIVRLSKTMIR